jgi:asparagine synthase (glutamine-hydrolysing)
MWLEPDIDLALGHRRLAIIDPSPTGAQPMHSASGRYVITYNGEIYGFQELRQQLSSGVEWKGTSDTEVLLAAIERWGVARALEQCTGMFAFALWDRKEKVLWLARDRIGEKPLYYALQNGVFFFGSELRALLRSHRFSAKIAPENLPHYVRFNYFPDARTALQGVQRLLPGHVLAISLSDLRSRRWPCAGDIPVKAYWDASAKLAQAQAAPYRGSFDDAVEELDARLLTAVKRQMIADVPVGAFLSGGLDSSTIVAMMGRSSRHPAKTFTIGYAESGYDEGPFAAKIAAHLGTDHTGLVVCPEMAMGVIQRLGEFYDEPLADQSQIAVLLVSQLARTKVTVALTGDGGDELLGGYNRHALISRVWKAMRYAPQGMRGIGAGALGLLSPELWDRIGGFAARNKLPGLAHVGLGLKMQKLRDCLSARDEKEIYQRLTSHWRDPSSILSSPSDANYPELPDANCDVALKTMFWDMMTYLPGDVLAKVDRASMAYSLETRAPFLDHTLVEWAWGLPSHYKVQGGVGKQILRKVLARYVPPELFERPKQGFGLPMAVWLRGPLKDWAAGLLDARRLNEQGYFAPKPVAEAWALHQSGRADMSFALWGVLVFQLWLDQTMAPVLAERRAA